MSVNGIGSVTSAGYTSYESNAATATKTVTEKGSGKTDAAAVYESSSKSESYKVKNSSLIAQMKKDSENRLAQMQSLVQSMFSKQGITIGTGDSMWRQLAGGNFTADADTIAQAKEDISEDGYWGVKQTSSRIFDFALALSGGDKEKMEEMKAAVEKGFKQATKSWGQDLPSISNQTYDSVMGKFDDWFEKN